MRRVLVILGLLLLFVGPLLRVAEAASDLARELNEVAEVVRLEEPDGGVGDESGDSIRADGASDCRDQTRLESPVLAISWGLTAPNCGVQRAEVWHKPTAPPWPGHVSRVVLFQCPLC